MQSFLNAGPLVLALLGIYLTSFHSYLLFHCLAEVFSIVIAFGIFIVVWNSRRLLQNHYLLFIGIGYFYVGGLDLLHTLAFKGMGVFGGSGANLSTELWIAGRYVEAVSLLLATVFLQRKLPPHTTFIAYGLAIGLLLASIFYWNIFPDSYIEGIGLTPFKIHSEYAICLLLFAVVGLLIKNSGLFDRKVLILLVLSVLTAIAQELAFTRYLSVYGPANMAGHFLKIISFYFLYKAIIETSLVTPCDLLFRDLKQSEAKFRSIFETNVVPIAYCSPDGQVIDANQNYLKLIGASKEELAAGEVRWDAITPPEWKHVDEVGAHFLKRDGVCPPLEKEYLRRDGTCVPVLFGACLVPGESGQLVAFAMDLTEQKKMEEELRRSRELAESQTAELEAIYSSAPVGLCVMDRELRYLRINERLAALNGRPAREHLGETFRESLPDLADSLEPLCRECMETGQPVHHFEIAGRDEHTGLTSHYLTSLHPLRDAEGQISGVNMVVQDITDRKRIEEALRESEERLRIFIEHAPASLAMFDRNMRYVSVSRRWLSDYKLTERDLGGLCHYDIFPEIPERWKVVHRRALAGEVVQAENDRFSRDDGSVQWLRWEVRPWRESSGEIGGIVVFSEDTTARKLAEDALRESEERLRKSRDELELRVRERTSELRTTITRLELLNQELQEFAYVASHDLQEPLRKIQTFCDLAIKRCAPEIDSIGHQYLNRVLNSAGRMRQLLRDLLEFSRVASKPQPLKELDLRQIVLEAADVFEATMKETGARIEIGELPVIEADESQMLQLFQNLIGNSLKYRSSESPLISIYAKASTGGICEINVKDNGIGFDQEYAERIFTPFQRLHGREEYDGTGMGLAICRKIVERHGGNIRADSNPGTGSTFIIMLPIKRDRVSKKNGGIEPRI